MSVQVLLEPPAKPNAPSRRKRLLNATRILLLAAGIGALGYYGYVYFDAKVYEAYKNWAFDEQLRGARPSAAAFLRYELGRLMGKPGQPAGGPSGLPDQEPAREAASNPPAPEPPQEKTAQAGSLIGRLDIPRLKVRAIVQEGVDDTTLRRAVGHVPGTALPGQDGNVGLAAHRDTFFRPLRKVRKNDRIRFETLNGDYEYVVDSIRIVTPNDVEVLAPSRDPVLTLVTCYPFYYVGHAPKRFIVRARQVETSPPELPGS